VSLDADASAGLGIVTKAAAIVEAIATGGEQTAATLSERIGEPTSSVYRLLANLVQLNWVERGELRGGYRLGSQFVWLGDRLASQLDIRRLALPALEELHRSTGQTTFLCVRSGEHATCVERIDGQDVQIQRLHVGDSSPLHEGAAPRVLLAFQSPEFTTAYLATSLAHPDSRGRIQDEINTIRDRGFALADDETVTGIRSIGAPVFDHRGLVVAAISISGLRIHLQSHSLDPVALVRAQASRVSTALGFDHRASGRSSDERSR
jgi:DNA-binding IclR family transcriptional regulator